MPSPLNSTKNFGCPYPKISYDSRENQKPFSKGKKAEVQSSHHLANYCNLLQSEEFGKWVAIR